MRNKIILGIVGVIVVAFVVVLVFGKDKSNTLSETETPFENGKIFLDLNGDGVDEYVTYETPEDESEYYLKSLVAYNQSGDEIARLPQEMSIKVPMSESVVIHKLDTNSPREYFSFDFIAGPHQSETMFFELYKDRVLPICHKEEIMGPYDCLFYSGNTGYLPVEDLDSDGFVELIETVDEYPSSSELDSEETSAIDETFKDQEIGNLTNEAKTVAEREKGGRGKMVVWAIYSYNGERFVEQTDNNYEKFYMLIGDKIENKMKKSELSQDSLDYIQMMKEFWGYTQDQ